MGMRRIIAIALPLFIASGCAGVSKEEAGAMKNEIAALKASIADANSRIEDIGNKFVLLHEKVESSRANIEKLSAVPEPPPALKLVSIGETGAEEEAPKGGKASKKGAPSAAPVLKEREGPAEPNPAQKPMSGVADNVEAAYNRAQDLFIGGKYLEARGAFLAFVKANPGHPLSDNALYWAAETYYSEKDFQNALTKFREVADKYPGENKAPDALLKVGFSYMELNNEAKAREALGDLVKRYPESDAADKAKKTIERLSTQKKEGL